MVAKVLPFSIPMEPYRVDGFAWYPYHPELQKYLTFKGRFGDVAELAIQTQDGVWLAVPRAICPEPAPERDFRTRGFPAKCNMAPGWKPRENQLDIIPGIEAAVVYDQSGIIQAGTGIGKTALSMLFITGHQVTTLVVVDQENILRQWKKALLTHTDLAEEDIGYIQGDICNVQGKKVVIAMLQSIYKKGRYQAWVYQYFGLIIFDECHVLGATEFSKVCGLFPARYRLGLSATPKRQDGLEKIFLSHIGPILVKKNAVPLKPKVIMVPTPFELPIVTRRDPQTGEPRRVQLPHTAGRLMEIYKLMAASDRRNQLIAQIAKQCYDAGRNTVIFTDLKEDHHIPLAQWLGNEGIPAGDIGFYTGGLSEAEQDVNSGKRIVLATYKATSKAVDCPWWDTAIMGTPHSDVAQICGRVLREHPRKQCVGNYGTEKWNMDPAIKIPVVFDLVDMDSTILQSYLRTRLSYYKDIGAVMAGDVSLPAQVGFKKGNLIYAPK